MKSKFFQASIFFLIYVIFITACGSDEKEATKNIEKRKEAMTQKTIEIVDWGPQFTKAGAKFNEYQGKSSLWFNTKNATANTVVFFNNQPLETSVKVPDLVTATVPDSLFLRKRKIKVFLADDLLGLESMRIFFDIQ